MIARLLIALFSAGPVLVLGAKTGVDKFKVDLKGIANPDLEATGITAEYNTGDEFYQGDMLGVNRNGDESNRGAAIADMTKLWPQGTVPYVFDLNVQADTKKPLIQKAIDDYHTYTCIKIVPRTNEKDYICKLSVGRRRVYWSWVGVRGGKQDINLQDIGCWDKGAIIHELMHALGFEHEQQHVDRDKYILIEWDNIPEDRHHAFKKDHRTQTLVFPYDFLSVMHYYARAFAKDSRRNTITTLDPAYQKKIGQRYGFSKQDIEEVNKLYKCNGKTSGIGGVNGCSDKNPYCASQCRV